MLAINGSQLRGVWTDACAPAIGGPAVATVRAERLRLAKSRPSEGENFLPCTPQQSIYKGKYLDQVVSTEAGPLKARVWDPSRHEADAQFVCWHPSDCAIVSG